MRVHRPLARLAAAAAFCCLLSGCESIGETTKITGLPAWERTGGPPGGTILDVAQATAGTLVASTEDRGIFRSIDGGASWEQVLELPPGNYAMQFAAPDPDTILALVNNGAILRSTDGGATWPVIVSDIGGFELLAGPGVTFCRIWNSIIHSTDGGENWTPLVSFDNCRLLSVTGTGHIYVSASSMLYRSMDNGKTWTRIDGDAIPATISAVATLPDGGILVCTSMRSVFLSTDDGATWRAVDANAFGDHGLVWHISTIGEEAWVAVNDRGIYVTEDGETWRKTSLPSFAVRCIRALNDPSVIVGTDNAGAWMSEDGGDSWSHVEIAPVTVRATRIVTIPGAVVASTTSGLWSSTDTGSSWLPAHHGIPDAGIMIIRSGADGSLWAMTRTGLYRSIDGGTSWSLASDRFAGNYVRDLDVGFDGRLWIVSWYDPSSEEGIYVSVDDGASWARSFSCEGRRCASTIAAGRGGSAAAGFDMEGVRLVERDGAAWKNIGLEERGILCLAFASRGDLLAGGYDDAWAWDAITSSWRSLGLDAGARRLIPRGENIFALPQYDRTPLLTLNGGRDWYPLSGELAGGVTHDIAVDADGIVWAATDDGVWRTAEPCSWLR